MLHYQPSTIASFDGSNRGSTNGHGQHNSHGRENGGVHSEQQQTSLLRSMSASFLSLGINDDGVEDLNVSGKYMTAGSGIGSACGRATAGTSIAGGSGSVTTISNCDTESLTGERERSSPSSPSAARGGGDLLSNSIHGLMNVGSNVGTLLNPLNPFSTSQKN